MSKSTFYEHKALYCDTTCGFPNDNNEELELNVDCDSDNESCIIPSWDDEDRQFFSEDNTSDNDDGNNGDSDKDNENDEMASEESLAQETESSPQPGYQELVSYFIKLAIELTRLLGTPFSGSLVGKRPWLQLVT